MKNIKHSEQNIKGDITKIMQSSAHKRFWQKFGGNSQNALKKFRDSFVCIRMAWEGAPTTKTFNTAPAT